MSIWFPMFAIDRVRRRDRARHLRCGTPLDGRILLLTSQDKQRQIVAACCEHALAAGVRPHMPLGQARSLFALDATRIEPASPRRDESALRSLAAWAQRFSPLVAPDGLDGIMLDVSGCARAFKGETRLLHTASHQLAGLGFQSRICIAPTFGCAWAMTRFGNHDLTIIADGDIRQSIAPLPIAALRIDADVEAALSEVGIHQISHVLDLPRSVLPARFGECLLLRLDQALGSAIELIEPLRPREPLCVERRFEGPTTQWEAVELTVRALLEELSSHLQARQGGATRLDIELVRTDIEPLQLITSLSRPNRDPRHLWSLLRPKLEQANLGFGIEAITITASRFARLRHVQTEQWSDDDHPRADAAAETTFGECLDTLVNRMGAERVLAASMAESHMPERAFRLQPATAHSPAAPRTTFAVPTMTVRPSVILEHPLAIDVMCLTPDGPLLSMNWRGRVQNIITTLGPERVSCEWWRGDRGSRDYFKVQGADGRWLWLFRVTHTARWFLHGVWA